MTGHYIKGTSGVIRAPNRLLEVTDGTTTVTGVTKETFSGATVSEGDPGEALIAVTGGSGTNWVAYEPTLYGNGVAMTDFGTDGSQTGEYLAITNPDGSRTVDVRAVYVFQPGAVIADDSALLSMQLPDVGSALAAVGTYMVRLGDDPGNGASGMGTVNMLDGEDVARLYNAFGDNAEYPGDLGLGFGDERNTIIVSLRYHTGGTCETFLAVTDDDITVSMPYVPGSTSVRSTPLDGSDGPLVTWEREGDGPVPPAYTESDPTTGDIALETGFSGDGLVRVIVCYTPA